MNQSGAETPVIQRDLGRGNKEGAVLRLRLGPDYAAPPEAHAGRRVAIYGLGACENQLHPQAASQSRGMTRAYPRVSPSGIRASRRLMSIREAYCLNWPKETVSPFSFKPSPIRGHDLPFSPPSQPLRSWSSAAAFSTQNRTPRVSHPSRFPHVCAQSVTNPGCGSLPPSSLPVRPWQRAVNPAFPNTNTRQSPAKHRVVRLLTLSGE